MLATFSTEQVAAVEIRETGYEFPKNRNANPDPEFQIVCSSHFSGSLAVQKPH
jgi:hypothetical protein